MPASVRIVKLLENHDMRGCHAQRAKRGVAALKPGQAILAFNKAGTIARVYGCEGVLVANLYCPEGKWDLEELKEWVAEGLNLDLMTQTAQVRKLDRTG